MFAVALAAGGPAVSFGIIGNALDRGGGSAALFLVKRPWAALRDRLWDKWRRWMERAG